MPRRRVEAIPFTPIRLVNFGGMGTTIRDYLDPEFVLLSVHLEDAALTVEAYFESMVEAPVVRTTVETANFYNSNVQYFYNSNVQYFYYYEGRFVNRMMKIAHHVEGDAHSPAKRISSLVAPAALCWEWLKSPGGTKFMLTLSCRRCPRSVWLE